MKKPMMKGIDISHWNYIKDYAAIKNSGIDFVIIKAGGNEKGKVYKDVKFGNIELNDIKLRILDSIN